MRSHSCVFRGRSPKAPQRARRRNQQGTGRRLAASISTAAGSTAAALTLVPRGSSVSRVRTRGCVRYGKQCCCVFLRPRRWLVQHEGLPMRGVSAAGLAAAVREITDSTCTTANAPEFWIVSAHKHDAPRYTPQAPCYCAASDRKCAIEGPICVPYRLWERAKSTHLRSQAITTCAHTTDTSYRLVADRLCVLRRAQQSRAWTLCNVPPWCRHTHTHTLAPLVWI